MRSNPGIPKTSRRRDSRILFPEARRFRIQSRPIRGFHFARCDGHRRERQHAHLLAGKLAAREPPDRSHAFTRHRLQTQVRCLANRHPSGNARPLRQPHSPQQRRTSGCFSSRRHRRHPIPKHHQPGHPQAHRPQNVPILFRPQTRRSRLPRRTKSHAARKPQFQMHSYSNQARRNKKWLARRDRPHYQRNPSEMGRRPNDSHLLHSRPTPNGLRNAPDAKRSGHQRRRYSLRRIFRLLKSGAQVTERRR